MDDRSLVYHEVVDDEVLSLWRILTHVKHQQVAQIILLANADRIELDILLTNPVFELLRRNLPEPFEACNQRALPELLQRSLLLSFVVAIDIGHQFFGWSFFCGLLSTPLLLRSTRHKVVRLLMFLGQEDAEERSLEEV